MLAGSVCAFVMGDHEKTTRPMLRLRPIPIASVATSTCVHNKRLAMRQLSGRISLQWPVRVASTWAPPR